MSNYFDHLLLLVGHTTASAYCYRPSNVVCLSDTLVSPAKQMK